MSHLQEDFKNWLYQIARWKVSDFLKKTNAGKQVPRRKITSLDNMQETEISFHKAGEPDSIEADEKLKALRTLLDKLSFEERNLLVLRHFEERTYAEIAQIVIDKNLNGEELSKMATVLRKRASRLYDKLGKMIKYEPILRELFEI